MMDWIDYENPGRYQYIYNCPICGVTVRCPKCWKGMDKYRQVFHCPDCGKQARKQAAIERKGFRQELVSHLLQGREAFEAMEAEFYAHRDGHLDGGMA